MKIALFDIDNTVAQAAWRDVLKPPNSTWDEYHAACASDKPNQEIVDLINTLCLANYSCLGFTRRPEKWRATTNLWMMTNKVSLSWFFMADDKEYGNHVDVKVGMIERGFTEAQRRDIQFVVDDDPETCAAITEKFGLTTMNIRTRIKN